MTRWMERAWSEVKKDDRVRVWLWDPNGAKHNGTCTTGVVVKCAPTITLLLLYVQESTGVEHVFTPLSAVAQGFEIRIDVEAPSPTRTGHTHRTLRLLDALIGESPSAECATRDPVVRPYQFYNSEAWANWWQHKERRAEYLLGPRLTPGMMIKHIKSDYDYDYYEVQLDDAPFSELTEAVALEGEYTQLPPFPEREGEPNRRDWTRKGWLLWRAKGTR